MSIERILRARVIVALLWAFSCGALAQGLLDDLAGAVANDGVGEVKRLLGRGMDPDSVDSSGDTLLCIGAPNGSARAVAALLGAKANPDRANRFGDTPLLLASLKGDR